jgi:probable phosphoglycerate mutase
MNVCMDTSNATTRFGLIRHAETVWNRERRVQGQLDSPLTTAGEQSAGRWGRRLAAFRWDRLLISDAGRAADTARRINAYLKLPTHEDARLRELDWGRWTAKTISQIRLEEPREVSRQEAAGWDFRPPGGESRREQLERAREALRAAACRWPGESILVVAHGGVIKCLAYHLSGRDYIAAAALTVEPYHLHWLEVAGGRIAIEALNAVPLPHGPAEPGEGGDDL